MSDLDCTKPTGGKFVDLTGREFTRLTVIGYAGKSASGMCQWTCRCKCGETRVVYGKHLVSDATRSCGCLQRELAAEKSKSRAAERRLHSDPLEKPSDPRFVDLTGRSFDRLLVVKYAGKDAGGHPTWLCDCSCGSTTVVRGAHLTSDSIRSCSCLARESMGNRARTHGDSKERLYWIYRGMIQRCEDPRNEDYGGRGITICDEWRSSYVAFREWALSHGYRDDLTIERKDVNGNYTPENCEWIPHSDQQANKRTTVHLTAFGETKHLSAWARDPRCIVPEYTLRRRVDARWDDELAIRTPQRTVHCLEEADIPRIREMIAEGRTLQEIADEFDVSVSTIMDVKAGRAWTWV